MGNEPYSDLRWRDNPMPKFSLCGKCKHWHGFGKCDRYESKVPKEIMDQSFPGTSKFIEKYCAYRENKE